MKVAAMLGVPSYVRDAREEIGHAGEVCEHEGVERDRQARLEGILFSIEEVNEALRANVERDEMARSELTINSLYHERMELKARLHELREEYDEVRRGRRS